MTPTTRIEIVIDAAHTPELITALLQAGAPGYTLIRDVQGAGDRGDQAGDALGNVFRNCYLLIAVPAEQAETLAEAARPLIKRYGGMCLLSDAKWLKH